MRVVVAMSGGVDSSAAALLLKQQGFDVVGVTMMLVDCEAGPPRASCCGRQAVRDAQKVAARLGVPHYVLDFRAELEREVIEEFCDEYGRGRTPNPCIRCNERLKFRLLLDRVRQLGAESLATGHYARLVQGCDGVWQLRRAKDSEKDQSYFLYRFTQEQMAVVMLPLGDLTKDQVRLLARQCDLPVAEKEESQEICFVTDGDHAAFLKARRPELFRPGRVVDMHGRELGRHEGIARYTVGQRKGLGIALGERWYIVKLDPERAEVVLGRYEDALSGRAEIEQVHWVSGREPDIDTEVLAKVRYRHRGARAVLEPRGDRALVRLREPQFAVTPGQSMVLYQDDVVLGGGIISRAWRHEAN